MEMVAITRALGPRHDVADLTQHGHKPIVPPSLGTQCGTEGI